MTDEAKNVLIGVFVVIACALFAWMLMFLHPATGDAEQTIKVRFSDIGKVSAGTRVTLAGRPVGEVLAVRIIEEARQDPNKKVGPVYLYELLLGLDSNVVIYETDTISLQTSGLLGERTISIVPKRLSMKEKGRIVGPDDTLYATDSGSMEGTISKFGEITSKASEALDKIIYLLDQNDERFTSVVSNLDRTLIQMDLTLTRLNQLDVVGSTHTTLESIDRVVKNLDDQLTEIKDDELWKHAKSLITNLEEIAVAVNKPDTLDGMIDNFFDFAGNLVSTWDTLENALISLEKATDKADKVLDEGHAIAVNLRKATDKVSRGEGTIGRLINGNDIYLRTVSIMDRADVVMQDINNYGLLFHLDKSWQRESSCRRDYASSLTRSKDFRHYFDREVDEIATSLSRVNVMMEKAEMQEEEERLLDNNEFTEVYRQLLCQVDSLLSSLKVFNQTIVER